KTVEYCAQHHPDAYSRKRRTRGCGKIPSFGVANTRTAGAPLCAQHARQQCGVEGFREKEVGPHHSGKETISNVILSGAKHPNVSPPPTKTSQPSIVKRNSCKRVRHPEITPTASKRAVAQGSTAGAVTMPDIDGQKSPAERDSSVKTEVQVSL
ncbi:unnamed protein product, partial [Ascophyllum nodosum]